MPVLACDVMWSFIHYRTHAPFIRRVLHELGHEVCIECGYLLRGLDDDVENCPECGAARDCELMQIARENDLPALRARHEERPARWEPTQSEPSRPRDG
jgi:rubrerythrin